LEFLDEIEIPYNLNPYLVRGLGLFIPELFLKFSKIAKDLKALYSEEEDMIKLVKNPERKKTLLLAVELLE